MNMKHGLSGCMIVRDESPQVYNAIKDLKCVCNEVIVVDTGSKDDTVEIAESMGCRVYHYKWDEHFGKARNFSFSKACYEWILYIDADETLSTMLKEDIHNLIKTMDDVMFCFPVFDTDFPHAGGNTKGVVRLFRKDSFCFSEDKNGHTQTIVSDSKLVRSCYPILHSQGKRCHVYHPEKLMCRLAIDIKDHPDGDGFKIVVDGFINCCLEFYKRMFKQRGFLDGYKGLVWVSYRCLYYLLRGLFVGMKIKRKEMDLGGK